MEVHCRGYPISVASLQEAQELVNEIVAALPLAVASNLNSDNCVSRLQHQCHGDVSHDDQNNKNYFLIQVLGEAR